MSDRAVYLGAIIVGCFAVILVWLQSEGVYWQEAAVAYVALVLLAMNMAAWEISRGRHVAEWRAALAKIPLRFVGYGTKTGRPLEAAHHQPPVMRAVWISIIVSVALVAALVALLLIFDPPRSGY